MFIHNPSPSIHRREIRWIACNAARSPCSFSYVSTIARCLHSYTYGHLDRTALGVCRSRADERIVERLIVRWYLGSTRQQMDGEQKQNGQRWVERSQWRASCWSKYTHTQVSILDHLYVGSTCSYQYLSLALRLFFFFFFSKYRYLLCSSIFKRFPAIITIRSSPLLPMLLRVTWLRDSFSCSLLEQVFIYRFVFSRSSLPIRLF